VFRSEASALDASDVLSDTLTLPEAVQLTLKNHPGIQAALARVRAAQADADQVRLLPNPILTVVFRFPEGSGKPIIEAGIAAELVQVLRRSGRISAADDRLRASSAQAVSTVLDVVSEVRETYYAAQSLQASAPLLEARRDLLARLQDLARSRLEAGEGSRLETTTLDAQRVEVEAELDDLLLELTEQQLALARLVGQPSSAAPLHVSDWRPPAMNSVRESAWIPVALESRPEVQAIQWELAALGADLRLAGSEVLADAELGVNAERDDDWSAGPAVSVPLPLFDWGQARRAKIVAMRTEAAHRLTQAKREVVEQVRRAAAVFNESVHELERVRTQLIPLQEQRRELAEAAFRAGQSDVTAVILAEQDLAAARTRAVALERKNSVALLRLERAVGGAGVAAALIQTTPSATSPDVVPVTQPAATTQAEAVSPKL
jgi:outer membrane protein TolC